MELEGEVQDQAQKIIEMPQRDRATSASENQPSSASVVSMYGQERPSVSSLHQQLASASGTQTIQLREELVLAVAQNASAQATALRQKSRISWKRLRRRFPIRLLRCLKWPTAWPNF